MSFEGGHPSGTVLAVAIEQGRLGAGIVGRDGEVLIRDRISTPNRDVWRALEQLIRRVTAAAPPDRDRPDVVAVSCDGPVDQRAGGVSPHLVPAWSNFTLREHLEDLTGLPVVLDTVGAATAEAERWLGGAVGMANFVVVVVDRTVESAAVIDGIRLRGALGNAGSLAHVNVEPDGPPCWCGSTGCLAAYVSATAIELEINRPLRRASESIVERTGIMLGRAIASMSANIDVTTYFLSGRVIDTFGDPLIETVRREAASRSRLTSLGELSILEPGHGIAPLVAAAALVR